MSLKSTVQCLPILLYNLPLIPLFTHTFTIGNNWGSMSCSKTPQHVEKRWTIPGLGRQRYSLSANTLRLDHVSEDLIHPSILVFPKKYVKVENINWWSFDVCYNFAAGRKKNLLWISLCVRVAIFNFAVLDLKSVECRNPCCSQILAAGGIFQLTSVKTL